MRMSSMEVGKRGRGQFSPRNSESVERAGVRLIE